MTASHYLMDPMMSAGNSIASSLSDVDVLVGIPTRHEADRIAAMTTVVDEGLTRYLPDRRAVIVNLDNCSSDGTGLRFHDTVTSTPKLYCSTPRGVTGKGRNVANVIHLARYCQARAVVLIDADVTSATPEWVARLLRPVLDGQADLVHPFYQTSQGGPLTNLLCYPIVRGLLDADIRQPIGGELALSASFVRHLAEEPLPASALGYGIDIHLTTEAAALDLPMACAPLGQKIHRLRPWHTIGPIAAEVATSLAAQLHRHRARLADRQERTEHGDAPDSGNGPTAAPGSSTHAPHTTRAASVDLAALSQVVHDRLATWPDPQWPPLPRQLRSAVTQVRRDRYLTTTGWVEALVSWATAATTACDAATMGAYGEAIVPLLLARAYSWECERRASGYLGDEMTIQTLASRTADRCHTVLGGARSQRRSTRP